MTEINMFRFHDLTDRLAAFSTEGGVHLRGDTEDVKIEADDAEVALHECERELARFGGVVRLVGPRKTSPSDDEPSLGLVVEGAGVVLVTTERLVLMATHGASQLGQITDGELHTFALPWDLVDGIVIADKRSLSDRVAGARTVEIFGATTMFSFNLTPAKQAEIDGRVQPITDEEVMAFLARAGATHRLSVSPVSEQARLEAIVDGRFELDDGERVAVLTADTPGEDLPPHLRGRVEQAPGAEMASSQAAHDAKGRDDSSDAAGETTCSSCGAGISKDDQFCGECGSRVELPEQFGSAERGMHPPTGASDDDTAAPDSTEPGPPAGSGPTCPKCHAAVAAEDRFCGECGTRQRAASLSSNPPEPAA